VFSFQDFQTSSTLRSSLSGKWYRSAGKLIVEDNSKKRPLMTEMPLTFAKVVLRFITSANQSQDQALSATGSVWPGLEHRAEGPLSPAGKSGGDCFTLTQYPYLHARARFPNLKVIKNSAPIALVQQNSDQER